MSLKMNISRREQNGPLSVRASSAFPMIGQRHVRIRWALHVQVLTVDGSFSKCMWTRVPNIRRWQWEIVSSCHCTKGGVVEVCIMGTCGRWRTCLEIVGAHRSTKNVSCARGESSTCWGTKIGPKRRELMTKRMRQIKGKRCGCVWQLPWTFSCVSVLKDDH